MINLYIQYIEINDIRSRMSIIANIPLPVSIPEHCQMGKVISDDQKALAFVDTKTFLHRINLTQGAHSLNLAFNRPRLHLNTFIMTPEKS